MKSILFCLEHCIKCEQTKELLKNKDIKIITYPHNFVNWTTNQCKEAKQYNVLIHLQITAPILVLEDNTKIIGFLKIKRWMKNGLN